MNLFDILSSGKKDLNEENVSSFLAWFLDPKQSHGCGVLFLNKLLNLIDKEKFQRWMSEIQNISVDVLVEEEVVTHSGKRRYIDIVILISTTENSAIGSTKKSESIVLAIENKIRKNACDKTQLKEEYEGLLNEYKNTDIVFLYLTPSKSNSFNEAFLLLPENITKSFLTWTNSGCNLSDVTIVDIFREILQDDSNAKINPLSNESKFILKSFVVFAENGFRSNTNKTSTKTRRNPYFKGTVSGLEGVQNLKSSENDNKNIYIGFSGGINALEKEDIDFLEVRPYKWDDNLENKTKANWILIDDFLSTLNNK